jgi:ferredoxin
VPTRVNPKLIEELESFGSVNVQNCYHCGDCSAICPHSDGIFAFPRKTMRLLQMGLEKRLETLLTPWLCYHCGHCSTECPQQAQPGEIMMSMRRWLIARYDCTGIAGLFYRSATTEWITVALIALLTGAGLLSYGLSHGTIRGPGPFLPDTTVQHVYRGTALAVLLLIMVNSLRMSFFAIKGVGSAPAWQIYVRKLYLLPWHFLSQKRLLQCKKGGEEAAYGTWLIHAGLVFGHAIMFVLVTFFLDQMISDRTGTGPIHILRDLGAVLLLTGITCASYGRLRKKQVRYAYSHHTDLLFLWLPCYIVVTGIFQHALRRSGLAMGANIVYLAHLMGVVPWMLRIPFSKWMHMIYRPLALFLAEVIRETKAAQDRSGKSVRDSGTIAL